MRSRVRVVLLFIYRIIVFFIFIFRVRAPHADTFATSFGLFLFVARREKRIRESLCLQHMHAIALQHPAHSIIVAIKQTCELWEHYYAFNSLSVARNSHAYSRSGPHRGNAETSHRMWNEESVNRKLFVLMLHLDDDMVGYARMSFDAFVWIRVWRWAGWAHTAFEMLISRSILISYSVFVEYIHVALGARCRRWDGLIHFAIARARTAHRMPNESIHFHSWLNSISGAMKLHDVLVTNDHGSRGGRGRSILRNVCHVWREEIWNERKTHE